MITSQLITNFGLAIGLALTAVMMVSAAATVVAPFIPNRDHQSDRSTQKYDASKFAASTSGTSSAQSRADAEDRLAHAKSHHPTAKRYPTSKGVTNPQRGTVTSLFPDSKPADSRHPTGQKVA